MKGRLFILLGASGFGSLGVFAKLFYRHGGEPLSLLFARFAASALVLGLLVAAAGGAGSSRRAALAALGLGAFFYLGQSLSFFEGLERAPAGLVVLLFYVWPLLVTLGGAVLFGERLGLRKAALLAVGLGGVALAVGGPSRANGLGIVLGLAAGVFYTGYILGGKRLLAGSLSALRLTALVYLGPALAYSAAAAARRPDFPDDAVGLGALAGVIVLGTIGPTLLLFTGLRRLETGTASLLSTAEPLVGVLLAYAVLGESLSAVQVGGGAMIVGAVAALSLPRLRLDRAEATPAVARAPRRASPPR